MNNLKHLRWLLNVLFVFLIPTLIILVTLPHRHTLAGSIEAWMFFVSGLLVLGELSYKGNILLECWIEDRLRSKEPNGDLPKN